MDYEICDNCARFVHALRTRTRCFCEHTHTNSQQNTAYMTNESISHLQKSSAYFLLIYTHTHIEYLCGFSMFFALFFLNVRCILFVYSQQKPNSLPDSCTSRHDKYTNAFKTQDVDKTARRLGTCYTFTQVNSKRFYYSDHRSLYDRHASVVALYWNDFSFLVKGSIQSVR